ncbi:MAG: PepSY-like domain-containing protein [Kiritimatiellae bacterium]|nr:PepSY-like domain-containing protein [Kiritimatiellia bacterium]
MGDILKIRRVFVFVGSVLVALVALLFAYSHFFLYEPYAIEYRIPASDVPPAVLDAFAAKYPSVKEVEWECDNDTYEAQFILDGRSAECYFLQRGEWMKTEFRSSLNEFPPKAREYLKTRRGYEISEIEKVEMPGSDAAYEVELENIFMEWDYRFDEDGNLLSRIRDG